MASPARTRFSLEQLAIPAVSLLITFLAYSSQYLFHHIEPGPLSRKEATWFNLLVAAIWWSYFKACSVDPGRKGWVEDVVMKGQTEEALKKKGMRWCKKCDAVKPPRAHHCKQCQRCIPKMDHHCPWTTNCVSHTNFPHFIRFVLYTVLSMSLLAYHLFTRCYIIWQNRNLPAYLGPPTWVMAHLLVLVVVNSITLFAISVLLVRALYSLAGNTTMIEEWEIERHEALVGRSRKTGGWVYANGGQRMRVERQEFPYDIGIWKNLCQGMGSANPVAWLVPFSGGPGVESAFGWEENGFEDVGKAWPPPDPDKMPRVQRTLAEEIGEVEYRSSREEIEAFKDRQRKDRERWESKEEGGSDSEYGSDGEEEGIDGEVGWTNSEGDRLRDYGVDEDADMLADDDIPLGELLRRRKARAYEE